MAPKSAADRGLASAVSLRTVLVVLVAGLLVASAGCSGTLPGGDGGDGGDSASSEPALDSVPAGVDSLFYVDVNGAVNDEDMRTVANATYESEEDGPANVHEAIAQFESDTSLDVSTLQAVTAYGDSAAATSTGSESESESEYGAAIFSADWDINEIVRSIENESGATLEANTHSGQTIYVPTEESETTNASYVGKVSATKFAVGSEQAVRDALSVAGGSGDALSGDVRDAFENTREDAYFRFAANVPDDVPTDGIGGGDSPTGDAGDMIGDVSAISGSQYTADGDVAITATATFDSQSAAGDVNQTLNGFIAAYRLTAEDEETAAMLSSENLSIEANGADLTITMRNSVDAVVAAIEANENASVGVGDSPMALATSPRAADA